MKKFHEHLVLKVKRESLWMIQSNGRVTEATAAERVDQLIVLLAIFVA